MVQVMMCLCGIRQAEALQLGEKGGGDFPLILSHILFLLVMLIKVCTPIITRPL